MKKISLEEFQKVVTARFLYDETYGQIAFEMGLAADAVAAMCSTFTMLKNGETEELVKKMRRSHYSDSIIKLAAEALKMEIPADVLQAMAERRDAGLAKRIAKKMVEEAGTTPAAEEAPAAGPHPSAALTPAELGASHASRASGSPCAGKAEEAPKGNDALYFIRILEELHEQNQLLRDLLDVVIPKWAGDLKDNQNANSDVLCGILKEQGQALDAIRCNTRKRGL